MTNYYDLCCRYRGRYVNIYDRNGVRYHGRIVDVDNEFVWLDTGCQRYRPCGFGLGFFPFFPIALATIGGIALASLFFWW